MSVGSGRRAGGVGVSGPSGGRSAAVAAVTAVPRVPASPAARRDGVRVVRATPPTRSAAAHQRGTVTDSPRNSAADDIPKTGTSREKGATVEAG